MSVNPSDSEQGWNTDSHQDFYRYYEEQSRGDSTWQRFATIQATLLRLIDRPGAALDVADVGCGAGTQARLWAARGHRVVGADINAALIALARSRAHDDALEISFEVASATALPWADQSIDLCIAPELLEHVANWQACLSEFVRILRPGGALYLSTSNKLCPIQEEFTLPFYSWYPGPLKRHYEHLALTTRPDLAGHATYPAVNWFTYYGLRSHLARQQMRCLDRFDLINLSEHGRCVGLAVKLIRALAPLRFCAHVATPYTMLLGFKANS